MNNNINLANIITANSQRNYSSHYLSKLQLHELISISKNENEVNVNEALNILEQNSEALYELLPDLAIEDVKFLFESFLFEKICSSGKALHIDANNNFCFFANHKQHAIPVTKEWAENFPKVIQEVKKAKNFYI